MTLKSCLIMIALVALAFPVCANSPNPPTEDNLSDQPNRMNRSAQPSYTSSSSSSGIGWNGWGVRLGLADDMDQVVGGAQFNLGEFERNIRFQPDIQLGEGDDFTTVYGTVPVYYRFETNTRFTPYAGGGPAFGYVDHDKGPNDHSDFEVGAKATGGLEWPKPDGQAFFIELSLGFGDVHDATIVAAWAF